MKELKAIISELGLNPIVLHEQPGGSRTVVEKLEEYSNVGYAFVVLTPDDALFNIQMFKEKLDSIQRSRATGRQKDEMVFDALLGMLTKVARQNVILEFGYFMHMLGRDRVCCLYKGNVELPSDMHGIVYIPFKESIDEVRDKVIKELRAAGYNIGA
jgi:predicted nucleotide-binding protein